VTNTVFSAGLGWVTDKVQTCRILSDHHAMMSEGSKL
jgi:hypothetical protein